MPQPHVSSADDPPWPSAAAGWYVTGLLMLAYTFSFIDRQVLNLLVEPIRADLGLSDTRISFLQGMAFVGPYVLMSVPIGRLVDMMRRVTILVTGVAFWSVMTALCGLSSTYSQLLLARVGVGAGEASLTPSAWSLMADYFPPDKLARPLSVFLMGPYLGGGLALIFGGQIIGWLGADSTVDVPVFGALQAWQVVFLSVGLPGLLLALVLATIKEPARKAAKKDERTDRSANMREIWAHISGNWPLYISIYVGISFLVVILYGLQAWVPTLLIRAYGWDVATAGKLYGTVALVFGSLGVLSGPAISRALARRGAANPELQLALFASVLAVLFGVAGPLMPTPALALLFIAAASYAVSSPLALVASVLQTRTPNRMRGGVAGLYVLAVNVIGLGVGPTLVALITDGVFGDPSKVGWSLSVLCGIAGTAAAATIATALRKDKQS